MNNKLLVGITIGVLVLVAVGAAFFSRGQGGPSASQYDSFAQCLADAGLAMYGSATCPFCAQQRAMFGDSFRYVREIECDPRNPLAQTELCIAKKITHTPTWILEDTEGKEVSRLEPGVQTFETLGTLANCPVAKPVSEDGSDVPASAQ
ncbi:MAG: hypothetical protein A2756_01705 [Candidatus Ryanbacteria bacterium RIFCSPHIGHO2_01_FULL_48_27]|uniref:Thioredoxin domain-containing protein n=2 Tax=Parcubacteria group TaxID=1794811 RepID=A0A1G1YTF0_9BACT|nr:MAG: hypothetical protein A3A24_02600 [Candidatus Buchananbacteria bacterium RIFCSPLOWO2_01_FULL_46_12]OGZ44139.1 MAG: hypothetical protein A2756_01705 [Candidatus Ryanbacteria bacterium RIFCSPHIGHO2_01_FULL_48_27]